MLQPEDDIDRMTELYEGELTPEFRIAGIPMRNGDMTRLSSQFLAVVKDDKGNFSKDRAALLHRQLERFRRESLRFRIAFAHGSRYRLRSQGRRIHRRYRRHPGGDRRLPRRGGGRVVLDGDGSFYGKRYVATNILLKRQHRTGHRRRRDPLAVAGRARLQV